MENETIKLKDFLIELSKFYDLEEILKPEYNTHNKCSECNKTYSTNTKFCAADGKELLEEQYEIKSDTYLEEVSNLFYDMHSSPLPEEFSYEYVTEFESYDDDHDGEGYFLNFILKRKSDGKHFEFTIDSANSEFYGELYEVKQVTETKTTWK